jgi:hypothetical protein
MGLGFLAFLFVYPVLTLHGDTQQFGPQPLTLVAQNGAHGDVQAHDGQPQLEIAGTIAEISGFEEITAMNPELSGYRNLKVSDNVYMGDKIITAKEQTVTIELREGSAVMIAPETTFVIEEYHSGEHQETVFGVIDGIVRSIVRRKYGPGDKFQVRTPASVADVGGTEFFVRYNATTHQAQVHTVAGVVRFAANVELLKEPKSFVVVKAGYGCGMQEGARMPEAARPFDMKDFKRQMWNITPKLNSTVPLYHGRTSPLPGTRPELERNPHGIKNVANSAHQNKGLHKGQGHKIKGASNVAPGQAPGATDKPTVVTNPGKHLGNSNDGPATPTPPVSTPPAVNNPPGGGHH